MFSRELALTWRVDQSNVVSFLQTSSLHQQSRHPLRPLVELQAGEGAGHRPLEDGWGRTHRRQCYVFRIKTRNIQENL